MINRKIYFVSLRINIFNHLVLCDENSIRQSRRATLTVYVPYVPLLSYLSCKYTLQNNCWVKYQITLFWSICFSVPLFSIDEWWSQSPSYLWIKLLLEKCLKLLRCYCTVESDWLSSHCTNGQRQMIIILKNGVFRTWSRNFCSEALSSSFSIELHSPTLLSICTTLIRQRSKFESLAQKSRNPIRLAHFCNLFLIGSQTYILSRTCSILLVKNVRFILIWKPASSIQGVVPGPPPL